MRYRRPISTILKDTRLLWDRVQTPKNVRNTLEKVLLCRTASLGAEIYSPQNAQRIVFHTCKSSFCPSCGHRATIQWQRERFAALPDTQYKGITLTMPDVLWPLFRDNPELTQALPRLAAALIKTQAKTAHGLKIGGIAVVHTSYLSATIFPEIQKQDLEGQSLYRIFEQNYKRRLRWAEEVIGAATANEEDAKVLQAAVGSAVLLIKETTYDSRETPIEYSVSVLRGDRYTASVISVRKD